ncbi:SAM-dependent methyltransferase [Agromyces terreus]|uniref:site-specific DNA-methyltransferase (adenine-specific) n=1 Tax=Agromyces terreus TaxID=424795 RepID=A0A9X2GXH8_9MICO|nr:BREX-1 system adenine-specific DNA-methyltransferase PglX [Agromyces terreus]MCP2370890.1 SAM-dependent methyltransferase [Agromyces terreus]
MDTKPLERFATQARRDLLSSVDARATAVLTAGSVARAERPEVVRKLEAEITARGRAHVIDKVAYTWFNRIIALRFMDARGYTDAGIVSPAQGQAHGQPEILAEAKRGSLDTDVVINKITAQTILGLLDGSRRSTDAEGEAYSLLLTEYCRFWHKSMPFMFEREGDYTELLVPAGLLADGAILSKAREVLTEEVCDDVEVIGWLYQFYISERKDEVFAGFKKNKKAGADEIPAATQLFTPHWIVRYLVENSLGRLWMLNRPESRLVDQMEYFIAPIEDDADFLRVGSPEELTLLDPACGSGHMLTYAFDLLYAIYEEAGYAPSEIPSLILTHNLHGTEIDPRAGSLAAFALTMKARAKVRTFLNRKVQPKVCVIEQISFESDELDRILPAGKRHVDDDRFWNQFEMADTLGSLVKPDARALARLGNLLESLDADGDLLTGSAIDKVARVISQARYLQPGYAVVVANPPYMGVKNASAQLADYLKETYTHFKSDLFSAFVKQCSDLGTEGGLVGIMSPNVWMYISAHAHLRTLLLDRHGIQSLIELPLGGFDGATVQICAYTFVVRPSDGRSATFIRLVDGARERPLASALVEAIANPTSSNRFQVERSSFRGLPGEPLIYWLAEKIAPAFAAGVSLSSVSYTRIGLITGDNNSYLREWFEVSHAGIGVGLTRSQAQESGLRWFPVTKGGEYRKWYGNVSVVVDWQHDGRTLQTRMDPTGSRVLAHNFNLEDIFKPGVTWSKISSGRFSGRYQPLGFIFNDPSAAIFPSGNQVSTEVLLAYLSSSVADFLLRALNPTLNFQPGNVSSLPWSAAVPLAYVEELAVSARALARADWDEQEVSRDFTQSRLVPTTRPARLANVVESALLAFEERAAQLAEIEKQNNEAFASALGLSQAVGVAVPLENVTLTSNPAWAFADIADSSARRASAFSRAVQELVSYAVGCMFGRYSLDQAGLILADQGATLENYLAKVPSPTMRPDADNVIPFVDDGWFEDDIVERFRQFLRAAFGAEHFEENLLVVEEALGVRTLRDYFITKSGKSKFYDDHVQRYKKRPIYWMFSSPKGSFNALIYVHRYNPSTVSTVLNEYLREYRAKLEVALANADQAGSAGSIKDQKEADRLRKVLAELGDYEHDVLYPLATQQIAIDLDDGVKANYPKFYPAVRKIVGLESAE